MATKSSIEWTELTWNPAVGCTKISPGCKNCDAETMARRLHAMGMRGYENGFRLILMPGRLVEPLERAKPTGKKRGLSPVTRSTGPAPTRSGA